MPSYLYQDQVTEKIVEVVRSFSEYTIPPTKEEAAEFTDEEFDGAQWERLLRHPNDTKSHRTYIRPEGQGWTTPGNWSR